jgi:molybdenum cofactor cytidylyltransferase
LGRPKQLLLHRGEPLLVHVVRAALAADVWPVIVVVGAHSDLVRPLLTPHPVLVAENPAWSEGMASSIRTGIATLASFSRTIDAVILAVCDQPAFSSEVVHALVRARKEHGTSVCAAHYSGRLGVPALFARSHFNGLASLQGDVGARALIAATAARGDATAVDLPELAHDIDEPGDYERARALSRGGGNSTSYPTN